MRRSSPVPATLLGLSLLASACTDDGAAMDEDTDSSTSDADGSETAGDDDKGDGDGDTGEPPALPMCGTEPPPGAQLAPALPGYAGPGSCPVLETGSDSVNLMQTDHGEREFILVAPSDAEAGEVFPVMFMYHWLGGEAETFYDRAEVQYAADYYRMLAVIPTGRDLESGVPLRWPFSIGDDQARLDEEFAFHDDLLACVAEQFMVDKECVSTMGVSAGAMFSAMLASRHGEHLSSFISLSGGTGGPDGPIVKPWVPTANLMPSMVLWGGPEDLCLGVDFDQNSKQLEAALEADGHFLVECVHDCTHATPPFAPEDPDLPTYAAAWEFMLDHPFWLEDGASPYLDYVAATGGLPPAWPQWCAIGAGNATIRQGMCGGSEC